MLGAILCSLVILVFLGELRMTAIAICTIPISVLGALIGLYATGNTINVMTLAGLALAIGPLVDSAIICLENTHRHLALGDNVRQAAFLGASEVAMPELVSSLCTFLVLAPLALMPGMGAFLFRPMALAVAFAMIVAYILSRSFVPSMSALLLKSHSEEEHAHRRGPIARAFAAWEALIDRSIALYVRGFDFVLRHRSRDGRRGGELAHLEPGPPGAGDSARFLSGSRRRRVRDLRARRKRHAHRAHRGKDRRGRAVDPQDARKGPSDDHQRDRRRRRLVGRLHAQRRPDGRGGQGAARGRAGALGPGVRRDAPPTAQSNDSPTWNLPSTPAA